MSGCLGLFGGLREAREAREVVLVSCLVCGGCGDGWGGCGSFDPPVGVMFPWVFWLLSHLTGGTGGFVARPSMYVMCVGSLLLIIFFIESW